MKINDIEFQVDDEFQAAWDELVRLGELVPTGEIRNGLPVYVARELLDKNLH